MHMPHHRCKVDINSTAHPEERGRLCHVRGRGSRDERLRGNAPRPEAVPARSLRFDEKGARTQPHCRARRDHPGGARTDHDQIPRRIRCHGAERTGSFVV